jgi:hypothetical protein
MAIKDLQRNKAPCPADNLLNEFFIETSDILIGHITGCFNTIFDSGHIPKVWSYGYIVPYNQRAESSVMESLDCLIIINLNAVMSMAIAIY